MRGAEHVRRWVITTALIFVLGITGAIAQGAPRARAAGSIHITGTVSNQGGAGVANVAVTATEPGTNTVDFGPSTTAANGTYQLDVEAGTYDFHFDPAAGSGLNPVVQSNVTILNDQNISVQLSTAPPVKHILSGVVYSDDNRPVPNVRALLGGVLGGANVGQQGGYAVQVDAGVYNNLGLTSGLFSLGLSDYPSEINISADSTAPAFDLRAADITQDLKLPATTTMNVTVLDSAGNTVAGKSVKATGATSPGGKFALVPGGPAAFSLDKAVSSASTDGGGVAHLFIFVNITFPVGSICVNGVPGFASSFCNTTPLNSDSGAVTLTLTQPTPPTHTFSGTVRDPLGNPVPSLFMNLGNSSQRSDANGHFSFTLSPGSYPLSVQGGGPFGPLGSPNAPRYFTISPSGSEKVDLTSTDVNADVVLPPSTDITVLTKDASGNPAPNVQLTFTGSSPEVSLVAGGNSGYTAEARDAGDQRSDANGVATFRIFNNTSFNVGRMCANFATNPRQVCNTSELNTGTSGFTLTLTQQPATPVYTFSGTVRDANGNPVPQLHMSFDNQSQRSDANGHFSFSANSGTYLFEMQGGDVMGPLGIPGLPDFFDFFAHSITLDHNIAQDIQLPPTANVVVTVKDENGNPLSGARVDANGRISTPLFVGSTEQFGGTIDATANTAANGTASILALRNTAYQPDTICASILLFHQCNTVTLDTVNGDLNLIFQQQPAVPPAPTNLTAPSPARQAVLSWTAASGADHYDVYRDGSSIGSATGMTYTDTTASDGTHSYFVVAVNGGGQSAHSNSVIVLVDATNPGIAYTLAPVPNAAGWNNNNVTVTFNCTDGGSGMSSCTSPVVVSTEGASQTVTGTAVDQAGNTASVTAMVKLDKTSPTITASVAPTPNAAGWNNANATVTFACGDALSGVATCTAPVTVSTDTAGQTVTGTTADVAGNSATTSKTVKLDKTAPTVGAFTLPSKTSAQTKTFTAPASDALSGVVSGEYYYGSDPGQGSGTAMTFSGGNLSGTLGTNLPAGVYPLYVRSKDAAGNWSAVQSARMVVTQTGTTGTTASGTFTPSTANGDQLPQLGSASFVSAQYNLTATFTAAGIGAGSSASFTYGYGSSFLCGILPTLPGCQQLTFTATSFSSLVFSGTNNGQVAISGTANVTVNGTTTVNQFRITLTDGARAGGSDHYQLNIYDPSNPNTLLYQASNTGTVTVF